jgi:hypothetical protein
LDFSGLEAFCADLLPHHATFLNNTNTLKVGLEHSFAYIMGVADSIA